MAFKVTFQNVDPLTPFCIFFFLAYVFKLQLSVSALLSPLLSPISFVTSQLCKFRKKITKLTIITWNEMVKRLERMPGLKAFFFLFFKK